MIVKGDKVFELTVNDPTSCTIGILALNTEDGFMPLRRMYAIADANAQTMEENRNSAMTFLVAFKPKTQHQGHKTTGDELVSDIHRLRSDRRGARQDAFLGVDNAGQECAKAGPPRSGVLGKTFLLVLGLCITSLGVGWGMWNGERPTENCGTIIVEVRCGIRIMS